MSTINPLATTPLNSLSILHNEESQPLPVQPPVAPSSQEIDNENQLREQQQKLEPSTERSLDRQPDRTGIIVELNKQEEQQQQDPVEQYLTAAASARLESNPSNPINSLADINEKEQLTAVADAQAERNDEQKASNEDQQQRLLERFQNAVNDAPTVSTTIDAFV